MNAAVGAALSVVRKALSPVADGLLEAWAASKDLGPNVKALKLELLSVKATLENTQGNQLDGQAQQELLALLRDSAYKAEDVLDELDYFRIQDKLCGTYEAADEHAKGGVHNILLNAHHTAKAIGSRLAPSSAARATGDAGEDARNGVRCCAMPRSRHKTSNDGSSSSSTKNTSQAAEKGGGGCMPIFGKIFLCSSSPPVNEDGGVDSAQSVLSGATMHSAPNKNQGENTPMLRFNRVDVSLRMMDILEQLRSIHQNVTALLHNCSRRTTKIARPITISQSVEPKLYGRDLEVNGIIHDMIHGKYRGENLTVLPIVGPGGIGKTTMTQHIYHSQQVQNHFGVVIWVCVSLDFNLNKLLEEIKQQTPKVEGEKEGSARELIEQRLESKRFLLILDDMWECSDEDKWRSLLLPLNKSQEKGSMILVTTRFPLLAEMVKTPGSDPIELGGLEPNEFRKLFQRLVFGDEQCTKDHTFLLETGDKIIEKLKGSPLAAKTVGRLLRSHLDLHHWKKVLQSKEWEKQTGDHDIMPALKLSFDYLPFHLQQCFFYCALFPEDYKFLAKKLISLWIGLDILHDVDPNELAEDIGKRNINDLVSHGFLIRVESDEHISYVIHDLLHDLAVKVASHECLNLRISSMRTAKIQPSIRHLSIFIDVEDSDVVSREHVKKDLRKLKVALKVANLQTLMLFGKMGEDFVNSFGDLFREAKAFRVLHLPNLSCPVESMLHNFPELIHLRYLTLGTQGFHPWYILPELGSPFNSWPARDQMHLPDSISRFYHLRILDLESWYGYLDLPKGMSNLENLCHFATNNDQHHSNIRDVGKMKVLQELKAFEVHKENEGFEPHQLEPLVELRELALHNLQKINTEQEAAEVNLIDKNNLIILKLYWDSDPNNANLDMETSVLESLQPHTNLQELCVSGHRGCTCPRWLGDELAVESLQHLHLDDVSWEFSPPLGKMADLRELIFQSMVAIKEVSIQQSFSKLTRFKLIGLEKLKKWVEGDTHSFPSLKEVTIKDCPALSVLPFSDHEDRNIYRFPKLQKLEIVNCAEVMALPPIPWTETLCTVLIKKSKLFDELEFSDTSFKVSLNSTGMSEVHSLDQVLVFSRLTHLERLTLWESPPLELKHLPDLISLKDLYGGLSFGHNVPFGYQGDAEWELPIEHINIKDCQASGEEVTWLLQHLPNLSTLKINFSFKKMTHLVPEADLQQIATLEPLKSSLDTIENAQGKDEQHETEEEVDEIEPVVAAEEAAAMKDKEEEEKDEDEDGGLLVLPAHLSNSLRELHISCELYPLDALQLQTLRIESLMNNRRCKLASCSSSCHPFPSSLEHLELSGVSGLETLQPLSNLTSLSDLKLYGCGKDLRCEGLLHLLTRGQLNELCVSGSPTFFFDWDPRQELHDGEPSCKLQKLLTDSTRVLTAPICDFLSSSLASLCFCGNREAEHFSDGLLLLTSLTELQLFGCLKLQRLPEGLNKLTRLKKLCIEFCPSLRSLPEDGLPSSLQELNVRNCCNEELKQQCRQLTELVPNIRLNSDDMIPRLELFNLTPRM